MNVPWGIWIVFAIGFLLLGAGHLVVLENGLIGMAFVAVAIGHVVRGRWERNKQTAPSSS